MKLKNIFFLRSFLLPLLPLLLLLPLTLPLTTRASEPALTSIYNHRPDLQKAFNKTTGLAVPNSAAGYLIDLEDWAKQYGWQEYGELASFAPTSEKLPRQVGPAVVPEVTASSYIVVDKNSGLVLKEKNSSTVWPIASITKLMTTKLVLDSGADLNEICDVEAGDDVGGAKLYVSSGATFSLNDLIYATLVGSANNAANAITRATGLDKISFVQKMNQTAKACGLPHTIYTDPTGIDPSNVSTAREIAKLAGQVFARSDFRQYTQTATRTISVLSSGETKKLTNTNWLLWKPAYDDIYVMAGKTGYLEESNWNLVTALRPTLNDSTREVIVVVFGSASRGDSANDAKALAEWTWNNFVWEEK
ncbi:MAG: serine hydrolase [Candidatus Uhrbacteria bacterium]